MILLKCAACWHAEAAAQPHTQPCCAGALSCPSSHFCECVHDPCMTHQIVPSNSGICCALQWLVTGTGWIAPPCPLQPSRSLLALGSTSTAQLSPAAAALIQPQIHLCYCGKQSPAAVRQCPTTDGPLLPSAFLSFPPVSAFRASLSSVGACLQLAACGCACGCNPSLPPSLA